MPGRPIPGGDRHARRRETHHQPAAGPGRYIDTLVETGTYASASEVVRAGLRALQERDAAVERWLQAKTSSRSTMPCWRIPGRALTADQVTAAMRAHHADRLKKAGRDS